MASGSERGGGGGRGIISRALLRGRKTLSGQSTMSARQAYKWARQNGASRREARDYTLNYMNSTR